MLRPYKINDTLTCLRCLWPLFVPHGQDTGHTILAKHPSNAVPLYSATFSVDPNLTSPFQHSFFFWGIHVI